MQRVVGGERHAGAFPRLPHGAGHKEIVGELDFALRLEVQVDRVHAEELRDRLVASIESSWSVKIDLESYSRRPISVLMPSSITRTSSSSAR